MDMIERRAAQRFAVNLSARVQLVESDTLSVTIIDISATGLAIELLAEQLPAIFPNQLRQNVIDTVKLPIQLTLPDPSLPVSFIAGAVYLRRMNHIKFSLGCRFESFADNSADNLATYLFELSTGGQPSPLTIPFQL